jgi:hypothetical protein
MPYTEENLKNKKMSELKKILTQIQAHKSAVSDEESKNLGKKAVIDRREEIIKEAGREKDLIFDEEDYNTIREKQGAKTYIRLRKPKEKHDYLIQKIIAVQDSPFIGRNIDASKYGSFDYIRDIEEIKATIDPNSGHVKYLSSAEFAEKSKKSKSEEVEVLAEPAEEEESKQEYVEPKPSNLNLVDRVAARRKARFDENAENFKSLIDYLPQAVKFAEGIGKDIMGSYDSITDLQKEMLSAITAMNQNVNRKDKNQINELQGMMQQFGDSLLIRTSNDQYSPQESLEIKSGLEALKRYDPKKGKSSIQPIIQKIIDKEEYKPHERIYEDTNMSRLPSEQEQNAPLMQKSGDKAIGDVRSIGFLGPMDALAKADDVIIPESERSKSIRRFTNFRWVDSIQNSKLGYDSPFQRMEDIDNRRRYGKCFMPTNRLPKDPDTQEELNKTKGFNTYPLVPSYSLSGLMQPATEFSYKQSTDPHARKINIDEKQFANKKLYNFEETDKRIRPTNPFASSFGMESIEQSHRNPNNVKNTLEFSSVMVDDDPFKRIKNKYKTNVVA